MVIELEFVIYFKKMSYFLISVFCILSLIVFNGEYRNLDILYMCNTLNLYMYNYIFCVWFGFILVI